MAMNNLERALMSGVILVSLGGLLFAGPKGQPVALDGAKAPEGRAASSPIPSAPSGAVAAARAERAVEGSARPEFAFHWFASGTGAKEVNLSNLPIRRDVVVLYGHLFGLYPRVWRGIHFNGSIPQRADLAAHVQRLKADIQKAIPDPNWDGYAVIDYESWWPAWEQHQEEGIREESLKRARAGHPGLSNEEVERIAAEEFEAAAGRFLLVTLEACKAERPRAKWGYYAYPSHFPTKRLDVYQPIFDASTAFYPSLYVRYFGVADKEVPGVGQRRISEYAVFMERVVRESRAVVGDRPILPFIWARYFDGNRTYGLQFLNGLDLRAMLDTPWLGGADGAIFWDDITTPEQARKTTGYFKSRVAGELRSLLREAAKGPPTQVNERTFVKNLRRKTR